MLFVPESVLVCYVVSFFISLFLGRSEPVYPLRKFQVVGEIRSPCAILFHLFVCPFINKPTPNLYPFVIVILLRDV